MRRGRLLSPNLGLPPSMVHCHPLVLNRPLEPLMRMLPRRHSCCPRLSLRPTSSSITRLTFAALGHRLLYTSTSHCALRLTS